MFSESLITHGISLLMNSWEIKNSDKTLLHLIIRDLEYFFSRKYFLSAKVNKKRHQASTDSKDFTSRFRLEKCE